MSETGPVQHSDEPRPGRRDLLACLLLAGALLVAGSCRLHSRACGQCHDDAIYVLTARALADGEGYRLVHLPGSPPQTKYPLLYPALLALVWKLWPDFPANLVAMQGLTLATGAVALVLFYLYVVRFGYARRSVALAAGLLCASASSFVLFTVVTMSEMLFALLMLAALWWLERAVRAVGPTRPLLDLLGGVLLALPFLCRSIGLLFVPLGLALLRQAGRPCKGVAVGAMLTVAPWTLWAASAWLTWRTDPVEGYYTDYLGWWLSFGPPALVRIITFNARWIATGISSMGLEGLSTPLLERVGPGPWEVILTLLALAALALMVGDLRRGRVLPAWTLSCLLLICFWPWAPHRFLIPLLPVLLLYLVRGLAEMPGVRRLPPALGWAVWGFAFAANVSLMADRCNVRHRFDSPNPELGAERHSWSGNERLFAWLRENTKPEDIIAAGVDPMVTLYTGRRSLYPILCPPQEMFYNLRAPTPTLEETLGPMRQHAVRYIVLTPNFHGEPAFRRWVDELQRRFPGKIVQRYQDPTDPRFIVYEVLYPL